MPYESCLKAMNVPSLVYRRYRGDMIDVYKYLHGTYSVPYDSLVQEAPPCALRGHNYKLINTQETLPYPAETSSAVLFLACVGSQDSH